MRLFFAIVVAAILTLLYRSFVVLTAFQTFAVTVVSLVLEAVPFLLLGAIAAAVVREFAPADALRRISHRLGPYGIPVAALSGIVAPVCECAIVPTVAGLRARGLSTAYAITLIVSVPILNPIVLVSTLAAFPGRPRLVAGRFIGGYLVAMIVGYAFYLRSRRQGKNGAAVTEKTGRFDAPTAVPTTDVQRVQTSWRDRLPATIAHALAEFMEIFGYFLAGATASALVQIIVPPEVYGRIGTTPGLAVLLMITAAYLLSVCSEADAFIGKAFLPLVGGAGVIAFLIFGPMLDLKNTVMLRRTFSMQEVALLALILLVAVSAVVAGMTVGGLV